jgi:hypothetical protein
MFLNAYLKPSSLFPLHNQIYKHYYPIIGLMKCRKAFVFSLDSFVAFTLTVAALYTLIFFSTVPSAYYPALMQANYLAKDTLLSLSTTQYSEGQTYLGHIIGSGGDTAAREYIGAMLPVQFGYRLETKGPESEAWNLVYDTAEDPESMHKTDYHKLKATAQSLYLVIETEMDKGESPYGYIECDGPYTICDLPLPYEYVAGDVSLLLVRLTVYT